MKNLRSKYFWFLVLTVVGYGMFEYYRPKPIDWSPSYSNKDKIPFGTRALYELLPDIFGRQPVESLRVPIYNHLTENKLPAQSNYIFVCQNFSIDKNDRAQLLNYVKKGNNAFISAYDFPDTLLKILHVRATLKAPSLRDTALVMNFVNPAFKKPKGYIFSQDDGRNYFLVKKAENVTVLAQNARNEPIFLKVGYGKGYFYLHNLPLALTNYYTLDSVTTDFAFKSLSYLPVKPTYWDEYLKQGRFGDNEQSIFRFVMTQPPLQWAYYLLLFGLFIFAVFAGKRTQRIIPVMEVPKNTSLEFVQTIGKMYFQQGDHANIAQKKIQHLLLYIRERFGIRTHELNDEFKEALTQKTGIPRLDIDVLFGEIAHAERSGIITEYALLSLNRRIEDFYQKTK
ncbi:DUF4350 domain-containing protein [Runella slithyformis]|uniref:DUF4350 domain-containing protein n=1 Tax=Runella slithyformis (strain ATCC 29530 / DSM 19594 / LMG 11500 / NCIMB 11436 / LSU 4) TaxID=761193 RepID=A0A7U3ZJE8_RUNSL|nr:DUF4350 domain-containing protein [Runella slithyformis]AEI48293.1 hypothetical protein Runsl_1869 [Runella slithyformis DSM 19594]